MTSFGKSAEKSATTSNDAGSSASMSSYTFSRTMSSSASMARGVNTLLTSLRIFWCSGGSIEMITLGTGMRVVVRLDHVEGGALSRRVRLVVLGRRRHVVVARQRPEVPFGVVVDGRLVAKTPIGVVRPVEELLGERDRTRPGRRPLRRRCRTHRIAPVSLYFTMVSHSMPASISTSSVCWPCSGAPCGTTLCSSNCTGFVGSAIGHTVHGGGVRDIAVRRDRRVLTQLSRCLHYAPRTGKARQGRTPLRDGALRESFVEQGDQRHPVLVPRCADRRTGDRSINSGRPIACMASG